VTSSADETVARLQRKPYRESKSPFSYQKYNQAPVRLQGALGLAKRKQRSRLVFTIPSQCPGTSGQSNQMTVGGEQKAVSSKNAEAVLFAPLFYGGTAVEKVLRIKPLISLRLSRYSNQ
jgi:hypothetical protein